MPELPEVQTVVDTLVAQGLPGRSITGASVYWPKTIAGVPPAGFCRLVKGCMIQGINRRGKYIVFHLSHGLTLLTHLRMSGRLTWQPKVAARSKHEHVILETDSVNSLRFHDPRKFGRMVLTETPEKWLNRLGPEPLDNKFTAKRFARMLMARKRQIKPLLLDQHFLAGLGNIYTDEALWEARIHPQQVSDMLSASDIGTLHRAIRRVLRKGLKNKGTSLGRGQSNFQSPGNRTGRNADTLNVFRRTGEACPRCRRIIERIIVGQRSSHICPVCQPLSRAHP
jgi:formamidopyrimidine-DNA glycosylase